MTLTIPEFFQTQKYAAQRLRATMAASGPMVEGIVNFGDFKVAQRGAGANMSVDVAAGDAWVQGDSIARQGLYHIGNDGTVNVAVPAANATNPRIDQVVLRANDSTVVGGGDSASLEVVAGTATVGATLANRTGAAALPATALRLADLLIPAVATTVTTANIGNPRDPKAASLVSVAGAPPVYAFGRPAAYVPAVGVERSGAQEITTSGAIAFNAADIYDFEAMHDNVTNNEQIVIKTPGIYCVSALLTTNGIMEVQIRKNGSLFMRPKATAGEAITGSAMLRFNYGDIIDFVAVVTGTVKLNGAQAWVTWMGP